MIQGLLPILRIFKGFDQWTHNVTHNCIENTNKCTVSVRSSWLSGFYVRNTEIKYSIDGDYTHHIELTTRGKIKEILPNCTSSILTEKIRTYLGNRQLLTIASRYEAQNQRIVVMLEKSRVYD